MQASLRAMALGGLPKRDSKLTPRRLDHLAHNTSMGVSVEHEGPSNGLLLSDLLNSAEKMEESPDPYGTPTFNDHSLMQGFGVDGSGLGAWRTAASPLAM